MALQGRDDLAVRWQPRGLARRCGKMGLDDFVRMLGVGGHLGQKLTDFSVVVLGCQADQHASDQPGLEGFERLAPTSGTDGRMREQQQRHGHQGGHVEELPDAGEDSASPTHRRPIVETAIDGCIVVEVANQLRDVRSRLTVEELATKRREQLCGWNWFAQPHRQADCIRKNFPMRPVQASLSPFVSPEFLVEFWLPHIVVQTLDIPTVARCLPKHRVLHKVESRKRVCRAH